MRAPNRVWCGDITYIATQQDGDFQAVLIANGIRPKMSGKEPCFDNAPVVLVDWFASLGVECAYYVFATKSSARSALFEYIELFYNRSRLHSRIDYASPIAYEQQYHHLLKGSQLTVHQMGAIPSKRYDENRVARNDT